MGNISKHFDREEFACPDGCGFNAVDIELLGVLEDIRKHFEKPVRINSACRCDKHNKKVGGVKDSQHKKAKATDIVISGVSPTDVAHYLDKKYPDKYGIGLYETFTHIDAREIKARWKR